MKAYHCSADTASGLFQSHPPVAWGGCACGAGGSTGAAGGVGGNGIAACGDGIAAGGARGAAGSAVRSVEGGAGGEAFVGVRGAANVRGASKTVCNVGREAPLVGGGAGTEGFARHGASGDAAMVGVVIGGVPGGVASAGANSAGVPGGAVAGNNSGGVHGENGSFCSIASKMPSTAAAVAAKSSLAAMAALSSIAAVAAAALGGRPRGREQRAFELEPEMVPGNNILQSGKKRMNR